jgi:hypothetical protein
MNNPTTPAAIADVAALVAQSVYYDEFKVDHGSVAPRTLSFDNACNLVVPPSLLGEATSYTITDQAMDQFRQKWGPVHFGKGSTKSLPKDYLEGWDAVTRAAILNAHLRLEEANGRKWLVRGYEAPEKPPVCRAILDANYPIMPNTAVLEMLRGAMEANASLPDVQVTRKNLTPDRLDAWVVWKNDLDGPDNSGYGLGCLISHSEVGDESARVWPLIWRNRCTNSIIVATQNLMQADGAQDFIALRLTHRGSKERMLTLMGEAIGQSLNAGASYFEKIWQAHRRPLSAISDVIAGLTKEYGWSQNVSDGVRMNYEGGENVLALVNAITATARDTQDVHEQVALEVTAGAVLCAPDSLFARAVQTAQREAELVQVR